MTNDTDRERFLMLVRAHDRLDQLERQHAATRWAFSLVAAALLVAVLYLSGGSGP